MEYRVTYTINGYQECEFFEADTADEAILMAIDSAKDMATDPHGVDISEYGFDNVADYVNAHEFVDYPDGFDVVFMGDITDSYEGFMVEDINPQSVEDRLFDFFGDACANSNNNIGDVRRFAGNYVTIDNGIIINCLSGEQIALTIQVL